MGDCVGLRSLGFRKVSGAALQGKVAEGDETIVGVFGVEVFVGPLAVEAALGGPHGIDEVHAAFVERGRDALLQCGERV